MELTGINKQVIRSTNTAASHLMRNKFIALEAAYHS